MRCTSTLEKRITEVKAKIRNNIWWHRATHLFMLAIQLTYQSIYSHYKGKLKIVKGNAQDQQANADTKKFKQDDKKVS